MTNKLEPLVALILELKVYIATNNIQPDLIFMLCHKEIRLSFDSSITMRSILKDKIDLESALLDIRDYIKIAEFLGKELKITII